MSALCGLFGNLHIPCELLGGLFVALALFGLCSDISSVHWMRDFDALKDCHEGLNPFRITLLEQVVLILPLQRTHSKVWHNSSNTMNKNTFSVCVLALGL
jgi:hypothetical protein